MTFYDATLLTLLGKHVPETSRLIPDHPDTAGYNTDVGEAKKASRREERRFRKSVLEVHEQLFRQTRNKCIQVMNEAKTGHVQPELKMLLRQTPGKCSQSSTSSWVRTPLVPFFLTLRTGARTNAHWTNAHCKSDKNAHCYQCSVVPVM